MDKLARQSNGRGGSGRPPSGLLEYLLTIQEVYRTELSEAELRLWCGSLEQYPLRAVTDAMDKLMAQPPRYEVNGEFVPWRGMPKLPDVLQELLAEKERLSEEANKNRKTLADENCKACEGTGWEPRVTARGNRAVVRCACWQANREALRVAASS